MEYALLSEKEPLIKPRIIIHGGAGNITRENLPPKAYDTYRLALLSILDRANNELRRPNATALDVATYAVSLLERNPLFNAGRGAVYTNAGTHELEASVMVSHGHRKRGCGVIECRKAKSPIKLAREMLIRGDQEDNEAQGHVQLEGDTCDRLNELWGLESVKPSYFWTRRRWDEHRRALHLPHDNGTYAKHKRAADGAADYAGEHIHGSDAEADIVIGDPSWDGKEYLPQGTVGAVVLDSSGVICVATSTGGLTNKMPGRVGDTPILGAGFWAEEWAELTCRQISGVQDSVSASISWLTECLPGAVNKPSLTADSRLHDRSCNMRGVAIGGTGNGDSFLELNAARTTAAIARYSGSLASTGTSLQDAVTAVAGPHGQLQRSAGDRWQKSGEGEGGIIGIDLVGGKGEIVFDHNCGGMFHAWIDDQGLHRFEVFQDEKSRGRRVVPSGKFGVIASSGLRC